MARADYPEAVRTLVDELKRLPGVGARSAERIAIWLMQHPKAEPLHLAASLQRAKEEIISCDRCGFFATIGHCCICDDTSRG